LLPARAQGGDILDRKGANRHETDTTIGGGGRHDRHRHGRAAGRERDHGRGGQRRHHVHRTLSSGTTTISGSGCLIVLDNQGQVRETFTGHGINGPWDMTALDLGGITDLFVTNVLNGTVAAGGATVNRGTVLRLVISSLPVLSPRLLNVTRTPCSSPTC
jgi:hypothetical protein